MALASAFLIAAVLAYFLTPAAVRLAWATGMLDQPAARKLHASATALLGGLAVFVAALGGWGAARLLAPGTVEREALTLLSGALIAFLLGLWDDRFGMQPAVKLLGQTAAISTLLSSGALPNFGLPPEAAGPVLLVLLVGLMNAVNFLDNMNGMLAGMAAISFLAFGIHSLTRGALGIAAAQLALSGACVGFLPWNFPRARIFLGDAGSLFLGYSLGASAVLACHGAASGWGRLGAALMLAYPAFDLVFVVINRMRDGRKIYLGGRDHSNHRLSSLLRSPQRTVYLVWLAALVLSLSGLAVLILDRPVTSVLFTGTWAVAFLWAGARLSTVAPPPAQPAPA
ncbi:MAG TPA: MraY family glycosyltransferase [Candidatus Eisenbacteria bacterium]|jgi:UDP-GlcNAc:undecaprenyl-phosphate GlcNAc-1-phosphate transferase